jgi:hypothetical protein
MSQLFGATLPKNRSLADLLRNKGLNTITSTPETEALLCRLAAENCHQLGDDDIQYIFEVRAIARVRKGEPISIKKNS